jgi:hypothetical protein
MKVFEIRDDTGRLTGFEISSMVGRWRACRAAHSIDGARVLRWPRRWALDDDVFCEFEVQGVQLSIEEPFGDNSRFAIQATGIAPRDIESTIQRIRDSFASAPWFDWRFGAAG